MAKHQETGILFFEDEDEVEVFTHIKEWQREIESKLGIKPMKDDQFDGKEGKAKLYRIPKSCIQLVFPKKRTKKTTTKAKPTREVEMRKKRVTVES